MNKWLSVELSLLLLVSLVAFAGFVSWQGYGDTLDNFQLSVLFGSKIQSNYILFNKDGSKRVILKHRDATSEDVLRANALFNYYAKSPGVVATIYDTPQVRVGQLFDFNPK